MLNPYQIQFLDRMIDGGVSFLVIGGQAKHDFDGRFDLDIWADGNADNLAKAQLVVRGWFVDHPMHLSPGSLMDMDRRQNWLGLMISFPDADVLYSNNGEAEGITPAQGIEILFGSKTTVFADYHGRSVGRNLSAGQVVQCLAPSDIAALPRLEKFTRNEY